MSSTEQVWFLIGIGGVLLLFEGVIGQIAVYLKIYISETWLKVIAGVIILGLALYKLATLPTTPLPQ